MANSDYNLQTRLDEELLRLTFCATIIATFFASLAAGPTLRALLSASGAAAVSVVLGLSAGLGFAYFLSVASALKYQGKRYVDRFPLSSKTAKFFYDASINVFGIYVLALLVEWVDTKFLHLPHTPLVWPLYLVLFSLIYVVMRVVWALAENAIEYYYDFSARREAFVAERERSKGRGTHAN